MSRLKMAVGLSTSDIDKIKKIFLNKASVSRAVLFGSRAKGTFQPGSDIDIALFGNDLTLKDILDLYVDLDELHLPYKFDLAIYDRITEPALKDHINRVGKIIYNAG